MTNYEKIRSMSKEDFAKWLRYYDFNSLQDEFCPKLCPFSCNGEDCEYDSCVYNTDNTVKDWLDSESEDSND